MFYVKTLSGKTLTFALPDHYTLRDLYEQVQVANDEEKLRLRKPSLILLGHRLKDMSKTLSELNITQSTVLHLTEDPNQRSRTRSRSS